MPSTTKMYVGTRNCSRPVCPPGSSVTRDPVRTIGDETVSRKPPSEVTRLVAETPFGFVSWASAGSPVRTTRSAVARTRETLMTIDHSSRKGVDVAWDLPGWQPSIRSVAVSRLAFAVVALVVALCAPAEALDAPGDYRVAVVATGIPRPAQLALTPSGQLVVLSHGWSGDSAAEIYWLDPAGPAPINAALAPRVVIPFAAGPRKMALGSLVVDPKSGDLYLGEENGNRIYRLTSDKRLLRSEEHTSELQS